MKRLISSDVAQSRFTRWLVQAQPIKKETTWTERRMAIEYGGHTYLVENDQIFQCAHCGHYDPQWRTTEILNFFEENFGIKPREIEITCSVAEPISKGE